MRLSSLMFVVGIGLVGCAAPPEVDEEYVSEGKTDEPRCPEVAAYLNDMSRALSYLPGDGSTLAMVTYHLPVGADLTLGDDDYEVTSTAQADRVLREYLRPFGTPTKYERLWHATGFTRSCGGGYFIGELTFANSDPQRVTVYARKDIGVKSLGIQTFYDPFADDKPTK